MGKRKQKDAASYIENKKIMLESLIAGVIMAITMKFGYVAYTYKKKKYVLSGLSLIKGKTVCGGKTVLTTNFAIVLILAAAILLIAAGVLVPMIGRKKCTIIAAIASIVSVVCNIYFASSIVSMLDKAKNVGVGKASIVSIIASGVIMIRMLYLLWRMNVVSALDFMAVPGMLYFVINNYLPMLGIVIAFKKVDYSVGIFNSPWAGLDNFKQLFATSTGSLFDSDAWLITKNTVLYNLAFIILGTIMGIIAGICLADICSKCLQKFFQTSILLPQLISYVIVAYIVYAMFSNESGFVNHLLGEGNEINFYAQTKWWPFILIFVYIWKMVGYNAIIFLSSIVGIDRSIYEAASIDGAGKFKQITKITLPLLKPTIVTLVMLNVGRIMYSDFGLFYQVPMDSGALYNVTQTIDTYVYRCLMTLNNISTSSAACTYQAVVGFILVFTVNMIVRKKDKENALF